MVTTVRKLMIGGLWLLPIMVPGQSVTELVADEVCNCLREMPEVIYPRLQARQCLERTAERYATEINDELGLHVNISGELDRLADALATPLTEGCPLLLQLTEEKPEPQLRYSDIPPSEVSRQINSPKFPAADPAESTSREVPTEEVVSGKVVRVSSELLLLEGESAEPISLVMTARQSRQLKLRVGQAVTAVYRSEWQTDPARIVRLLLSVK